MSKYVLAFLVLITISRAACPATSNINNLLADSLTFTVNANSSVTQQTYNYQYQTQFSSAPSLALALQNFGLNFVGPNNFAVSPQAITTTGSQFLFAFTPAVWSTITINFFASSNPQLQVGYLQVSNLQFGASNCAGCALVYANLQTPFAPTENPITRVFLNGFNLDAKTGSLQISVSPINLQNTTITLKVTLGKLTIINSVALSWVAFSPSTAPFLSYGGQISQNQYSGSVSSDVSSSIYQSQYTLYGLTLLSITSTKGIAFGSAIDSNFILTISSSLPIDNFALVYVALGQPAGSQCSSCGAANINNAGTCVSQCPDNTYAFSYKDGGVACRSCSSKLGLILVNGKCVPGTAPPAPAPAPPAPVIPVVPVVPVTPTPPPVVPVAPVVPPTCGANSYFNGNQCVCQVGYVSVKGVCSIPSAPVSVPIIITYPTNKNACNNTPTPIPTPTPPSNSTPTPPSNSTPTPPSNSTPTPPSNSTPTPPSNSTPTPTPPSNSTPSPSGSTTCGANSYDNGLGVCVCNTGYYQSGSTCVLGQQCGANTIKKADGTCICAPGFTNYNGICSQCPPGAFWSSASSKCIFVCGQNAIYSAASNGCVCVAGYGILSGQCQQCPNSFFISNGYCVTCPVNSAYNPNTLNCDCAVGFYTNQYGICTQKCGTNEVYNTTTLTCNCLQGLARVNGACTVCPTGTQPTADGSACSVCGPNQQLVNGVCSCQPGYAFNTAQVCTACASLTNGFIINGLCSVCPKTLVYDGVSGCKCPSGKVLQGSICVSQCRSDEILDSNGNCYTCGANQVISNNQCVCITGYTLSSCGVCQLTCSGNQFIFQGGCAICPLNTVYKPEINGCDCPTGYYKDNFGVCQQLVLKPVSCSAGQYFDSTNGCVSCPGSCQTCSSATVCTACVTTGYAPNSAGVCAPKCGDGLIVGNESCDTGLSYSAGCISCQIQSGYSCSGQPSVCQSNTPAPAPTPTPTPAPTPNNSNNSSGIVNLRNLYQSGNATINSNNVFITLKTNPTFTFNNPTDMQSFLQASFPGGPKPTVYCSQRANPNLDTFDCLLIYPSGVPNNPFTVNFSYSYQGKSGSATVNINPLLAGTNARRQR